MKKVYFVLYCLFFIALGYSGMAGFYATLKWAHTKQHKILVCISSYKRPLLLSGQILRFQHQTYNNFDVSVSIKGAPEKEVRETFMQEWTPLLEQNRLFVRFDQNRNQLENFLDTVRYLDFEKYDYFCKIDDDDWYTPDYLEDVNNWLNKEDDITISASRVSLILENDKDTTIIKPSAESMYGPTMCFSKKVIKALLELEKNPAHLEPKYSRTMVNELKGKREDRLMDEVAGVLGKRQFRVTPNAKIIFGKQYPGVTRP